MQVEKGKPNPRKNPPNYNAKSMRKRKEISLNADFVLTLLHHTTQFHTDRDVAAFSRFESSSLHLRDSLA
jgi:hypothetical protein